MGKFILISIVLVPIALAGMAARDPRPVRGFKRLVMLSIGFHVLYVLAVLFIYPRVS